MNKERGKLVDGEVVNFFLVVINIINNLANKQNAYLLDIIRMTWRRILAFPYQVDQIQGDIFVV